ncbi:MAG: hypothetical protein EXS49_02765 [Candidatus Pacebacteria bacterium]|nr:hypothetical protein [Candidatus Paceibacterota bacterium]
MPNVFGGNSYTPVKISFKEIESYKKTHSEIQVIDRYEELLEEIFLLRNAKYKFDKNYSAPFKEFIKTFGNLENLGNWFYFPWINSIIHFLPEEMHFEMRTGRNKNLITKEEQEKYYNSRVGILGMSVGSHVAMTLAMTGGAKTIKIADFDILSGSNLNRIRTGYHNIGVPKVHIVARDIYLINPYANVKAYPEGLTPANMEDFLNGEGKLDCLVEEMDNPFLKLKVREVARSIGIPVIMGTDNGDNIIIDIERFDLKKSTKIFNGIIGNLKAEDFAKATPQEIPKLIAKLAGANLAPIRMLHSVMEVGKTLYSFPQLGTAANLCGSVLSYLVRKIILGGKNIKSGRLEVNLNSIFESDYFSAKEKSYRKKEFEKFIKGPKK